MFSFRRALLDRSSHWRQDALVQHSYFAIVRLGRGTSITNTKPNTHSYSDSHTYAYGYSHTDRYADGYAGPQCDTAPAANTASAADALTGIG